MHDGMDYNYFSKYNYWVTKAYTENAKNLKWCPSEKECEYVVAVTDNITRYSVICKCGYAFCIKCNCEDHRPANCFDVEKWKQKETISNKTSEG